MRVPPTVTPVVRTLEAVQLTNVQHRDSQQEDQEGAFFEGNGIQPWRWALDHEPIVSVCFHVVLLCLNVNCFACNMCERHLSERNTKFQEEQQN